MLFNGDKLYMLPSVTPLQCMGFLLAGGGDVIGIDSCTKNEADELEEQLLNPSSVVYRVETRGKSILFLGDMDWRAEEKILREFPEELKCPVIQMAHHGQQGVSEEFYRHIRPEICLWPTPEWLWNNDIGGGYGTGPYKTLETRAWMEKLGTVNYHFEDKVTVLE